MSLRLLLVGLGNRSTHWRKVIDRDPAYDIAGVMDVDPARIAAFLEGRAHVPAFDDLPRALAEVRPTPWC